MKPQSQIQKAKDPQITQIKQITVQDPGRACKINENRSLTIDAFISPTQTNLKSKSAKSV
jgi:hypothetical protein